MGKATEAKKERRYEARAIGDALDALREKRLEPSFAIGCGTAGYACQKRLLSRIEGKPHATIRGEGFSILAAIEDFAKKVRMGAVIEDPPAHKGAQSATAQERLAAAGIVVAGS